MDAHCRGRLVEGPEGSPHSQKQAPGASGGVGPVGEELEHEVSRPKRWGYATGSTTGS